MKDVSHKLRVALVQATPVMFNKDATIDKVCAQIREAGANGAELIVFPESLIPCYPYGLTYGFTVGSRTEAWLLEHGVIPHTVGEERAMNGANSEGWAKYEY